MVGRLITLIVAHCAATPNGVALGRDGRTAAQVIDTWHGRPVRDKQGRTIRTHMFERTQEWRAQARPHLRHIGYHYVIDTDGTREAGRDENERGAHVAGHNLNSIGVCLVGTDQFTLAQWDEARRLATELLAKYPKARLCGHRDLSPDKDGDGRVESHEWLKICPGFDATSWWLLKKLAPFEGHIFHPGGRP